MGEDGKFTCLFSSVTFFKSTWGPFLWLSLVQQWYHLSQQQSGKVFLHHYVLSQMTHFNAVLCIFFLKIVAISWMFSADWLAGKTRCW